MPCPGAAGFARPVPPVKGVDFLTANRYEMGQSRGVAERGLSGKRSVSVEESVAVIERMDRMREDDMAKKKAAKKRGAAAQKKANHRKRIHARRSTAKLAEYALAALEAGEVKRVREYLEAIRGVAVSADQDVPGWDGRAT
jgi:hypothetical protein